MIITYVSICVFVCVCSVVFNCRECVMDFNLVSFYCFIKKLVQVFFAAMRQRKDEIKVKSLKLKIQNLMRLHENSQFYNLNSNQQADFIMSFSSPAFTLNPDETLLTPAVPKVLTSYFTLTTVIISRQNTCYMFLITRSDLTVILKNY